MIGGPQGRFLRYRPVPTRETKGRKKAPSPSRPPASANRVSSQRPAAPAPSRTAYRRAPLGSLRVFVAVAEHKSFTRGADALGLTTSAASMQVQALEDYLRVSLFRRNGRQVELTSEG